MISRDQQERGPQTFRQPVLMANGDQDVMVAVGFSEAAALELRNSCVELSVIRPSLCHTDLTSGFTGLRGMPFIQAEDVARRIVDTLERPRFDVPVPRRLGPALWLNQALPFRARAAVAHLTKADDVLAQIDAGERAAYNERIGRGKPRQPERHLVAVSSQTGSEGR